MLNKGLIDAQFSEKEIQELMHESNVQHISQADKTQRKSIIPMPKIRTAEKGKTEDMEQDR